MKTIITALIVLVFLTSQTNPKPENFIHVPTYELKFLPRYKRKST